MIQINLEHSTIAVWNLVQSWSILVRFFVEVSVKVQGLYKRKKAIKSLKGQEKQWRLSTFDEYMNLNIFIRMFYPFDMELPMFSHLLQLSLMQTSN